MFKRVFFLFVVVVLLFGCLASAQSDRLLERSDLTYLGAFRASPAGEGNFRIAYGGDGLAYSSERNSLFLGCHKQSDTVGEIAVVEPSMATGYNQLPLAEQLQTCADPFDGRLGEINVGQDEVSGLLPYEGRLITTAQGNYDAGCVQVVTHGAGSFDLGLQNDFTGFSSITGSAKPRAMAGYMALIPPEWQSQFGGPAFTSNSGGNIVSCLSAGPGATVFDPSLVGTVDPVPGETLLDYPDPNGPVATEYFDWRSLTTVDGAAFVQGTRTILYFGRNGEQGCYGFSTRDPDLHGLPSTVANRNYCYDYCSPSWGGLGTSGHPRTFVVWAYDAAELLKVKAGLLEPWELEPYGVWSLPEIVKGNCEQMRGATYDPATQRVYIAPNYGEAPIFHVYQLNVGPVAAPDITAPASPTGLVRMPNTRSVEVQWSPNAEPDLAGYHMYASRTSADGPWDRATKAPIHPTKWMFLPCDEYSQVGCLDGSPVWARVGAADLAGNESFSSPLYVSLDAPPACVEGDPCWCEPDGPGFPCEPVCVEGDPCWCEEGGPGFPCESVCVPSDVALLINGVSVYETLVGCSGN